MLTLQQYQHHLSVVFYKHTRAFKYTSKHVNINNTPHKQHIKPIPKQPPNYFKPQQQLQFPNYYPLTLLKMLTHPTIKTNHVPHTTHILHHSN